MEISFSSSSLSFFFFISFFLSLFHILHSQQTYVNNQQLDCYNNASQTLGYVCNNSSPSCNSYLIFRSQPPYYDSAVLIAYLFGADSKTIAETNKISDVEKIPKDTPVIVPVNCSCSGNFYQHNATYTLKTHGETYFLVANDTYQGMTTCQAIMNQNPYESRKLSVGLDILVPLRCACPSRSQINDGVRYLLTYLITWHDDIPKISQRFQVDERSVLDANELSESATIFPFTPLLIPLKTEPTTLLTVIPPPPPVGSPQPSNTPVVETGSKKKWVFVGIGVGVGFCILALCGVLIWFLLHRRKQEGKPIREDNRFEESAVGFGELSGMRSGSVFSQGIREVIESLTVYKFEELQRATDFFSEDCIIKGSVYRGVINGDNAAIKRMKGNVSNEINILKQIRHSNVIRLSGFCLHEGNTYLVYEFAEKGSLSDWLHEKKYQSSSTLTWKQRVQIAHDIADGLNYLHNYANPQYIHKDLKSSNILLDGNFRAKVANFGLARLVENQEGLQMTRHVVGTQGYMAPEYLEHGLVTPKVDVFAFGVVMLELLSGREATTATVDEEKGGDLLLSMSIRPVLEGENVRGKLRTFIDPCLQREYPFDLAFTMAKLAMNCVAHDLSSRPTIAEVFMSLSKILSSSLDWDPSSDIANSGSIVLGR
ncbi:protein LYK5 [Magnolia sinica]|uniref:protein LYK5 n=1 Tax=Magnolia sinica TaxID=86752 RepID=UPI002657CF82|nr:protein LYK5 [Magnolia sinica]